MRRRPRDDQAHRVPGVLDRLPYRRRNCNSDGWGWGVTELFVLIPGDPFGKQSVRVSMRGGFAHKYMPPETTAYEARCRAEGAASMRGRPLITGPVELKLQLFMPIPKSWSKKRKDAARTGRVVPTKKPDSSNCLKAIEDGFTGAIWVDDCQVVDHHITKRFSDEPCVIAIITELDLESC